MGKINQKIAQRIINEYCHGKSTYELADRYGLWQTSISNLIAGRTWTRCERPPNIEEIVKARHEKGLFKKGRWDEIHESYPELTSRQQEIIVGSLLGDGSLHKTRKNLPNSCFAKGQCQKYKEYVGWHYYELQPFSKPIKEIYSQEKLIAVQGGLIVDRQQVPKFLAGYRLTTCFHPHFTEYRHKWYPDGKKALPADLRLTPLTISIWFCDDGCNHFQSRQGIICTQSFTMEEADFLCELLKEYDIQPNIVVKVSPKTGQKQPILKINSKSYDNLVHLIKPHVIWDCMAHKVKFREAQRIGYSMAKFTDEDILRIYEMSKTHKQYEIATKFGVHKNTISAILCGRSWQHLSHLSPYIFKPRRGRANS